MEDREICPAEIGLPTGGVSVERVEQLRGYRRVRGTILPVGETAPGIGFQVNLPDRWNGMLLQLGGGGFNGTLVTGEEPVVGQDPEAPTPLQQGYATCGSDGGHRCVGWDSRWALDSEALWNFAADQLKKTRDAAVALLRRAYGWDPERVYFLGGSNGGREGLKAAQCFPEDYDGVVSLFPVLNWVPKALADVRNTRFLLRHPAGWLDAETYARVQETIVRIRGGETFVSDPETGEECPAELRAALMKVLTPEQLWVLDRFAAPCELPFPLANGVTEQPGYAVYRGAPLRDAWLSQYGSVPGARDGAMAQFSDAVLQYQVARSAHLDVDDFRPEEHRDALARASALLDATDTDLVRFFGHGGKLLLLHGLYDQIVTYYGTRDYYRALERRFGGETLRGCARLFLIPGYGHGCGPRALKTDLVALLDAWVRRGIPPETVQGTKMYEAERG